jgi:hypothetical protein
MAQASQSESTSTPHTVAGGYLFGVPLGDLGWFTTLLMSGALGMAAFFAATFCAIIGTLFYSTATHHAVDYALTYRRVGLPVGVLVLLVALGYLGSLWIRRQLRRA